MKSRPSRPTRAAVLAAAVLSAAAPFAARAAASPADASSPAAPDNSPPREIHPVVGALVTGTVSSDDQTVANPDGSVATGKLGGRWEVYGGAEFPLTASGLRLRLTVGLHVGSVDGPDGRETFTRVPLEASLWWPLNDDLRLGAGVRYPARMRFGGAGGNDSAGLSATPGFMALADWRVAPHVWLDVRYVSERYSYNTGGSADASHWGVGASALY